MLPPVPQYTNFNFFVMEGVPTVCSSGWLDLAPTYGKVEVGILDLVSDFGISIVKQCFMKEKEHF